MASSGSQGGVSGFWGTGYGSAIPKRESGDKNNWGDIYLGDTGTAVQTLALCYHMTDDQKAKATYLDRLNKYYRFITHGCNEIGCGRSERGNQSAAGFVDSASGAIGCGYYKGHLSTVPYTVATATSGVAFGAELYAISSKIRAEATDSSTKGGGSILEIVDPLDPSEVQKMVSAGIKWISSTAVDLDGSIAYIIDGTNDTKSWPLDTASYVTEGIVAIDLHIPSLRPMLRKSFRKCDLRVCCFAHAAAYMRLRAHCFTCTSWLLPSHPCSTHPLIPTTHPLIPTQRTLSFTPFISTLHSHPSFTPLQATQSSGSSVRRTPTARGAN
jgi:hypothetical protein